MPVNGVGAKDFLTLSPKVHDLDCIVASISGGGLVSGICVAAKVPPTHTNTLSWQLPRVTTTAFSFVVSLLNRASTPKSK